MPYFDHMKYLLAFIVLLLIFLSGCPQPPDNGSPGNGVINGNLEQTDTFFMIHFEVGASEWPWNKEIAPDSNVFNLDYQEALWPTAVELVDLANEYDFDLTLAFNPQWGEYILQDPEKISIVKEWQIQGHEIAFHHHAYTHKDWHGFSDRTDSEVLDDPRYRGTLDTGVDFIRELAEPEDLITGSSLLIATGGGINNPSDARKKPVMREMPWGEVLYFSHARLMTYGELPDWLPVISLLPESMEEYVKTEEDEVFGMVIHCHDFYNDKTVLEDWFEFIESKGDKIQTVQEITRKFYPDYLP